MGKETQALRWRRDGELPREALMRRLRGGVWSVGTRSSYPTRYDDGLMVQRTKLRYLQLQCICS